MQGTKGERPEERRRREADQRQSWDGGSDKEGEEDRDKEKEINNGDKVTPNTRWERQELGLPSLGSSAGPLHKARSYKQATSSPQTCSRAGSAHTELALHQDNLSPSHSFGPD